MENNDSNRYDSKKSMKWILLYVIIGIVVYGLIYYFFFSKNGGYSYNPQQYQTQNNNHSQPTPTIKSGQDLLSISQSLDATNENQLDNGLNQNDADAHAF